MQRLRLYWILEEIGFLTVLALPASIESFSEGLQIKLSNVFIGRTSGNNIALMLSALFIGQTVFATVAYPISEGFGIYVNILCSQAYGAKQYKVAGLYFYRAQFMAALTCFPVFTIFISVRPVVYFIFQDWELAQYAGSYTNVLCFGYPAYLYYKICLRFLQALNIVWGPVLYLIIGNILNGVIQYIFIFHYNTNIEGAAAGYVISNYLVALLVFAHIRLSHVHSTIVQKWSIEYITNWIHTAKYAIVPLFQSLLGAGQTTLLPIILIGIMAHNNKQLAIYSVMFSLFWILALGSNGFASAITVRVGNLLGENEQKKSQKSAITGVIMGQFCLLLCSIVLQILSEPLSYLFTTDPNFAEELNWNIRIFSFLINTDFKILIQGVMNACCKQGIQFVLKFVSQLIIGTLATIPLVYYVQWKALSVLVVFSTTNIICSIIGIFILLCSKWENIALVVGKNTLMNSSTKEEIEANGNKPTLINMLFESTVFVYIRYLFCIALSMCVFTATALILL